MQELVKIKIREERTSSCDFTEEGEKGSCNFIIGMNTVKE
jgi:hypothetical protein